jgi:cardiolipin synthase
LDTAERLVNRAVPNLITLGRLLLVPMLAWLLLGERYVLALAVFLGAALSDFADGAIARRYRIVSELGARLDPVADKLTMLAATVLLALQGWLPAWLAVAIVLRDIVITAGAVAYRLSVGHVEMAPTPLSKINTALEFVVLAAALAHAAELVDASDWLGPLFAMVFATVILSGAQYVWVWGAKAAAQRGAGGGASGGGG